MVDSELIERTKKTSASSRRILVTGATGFVGRRLAATLAEAGCDVIATGRNRYLAPANAKFVCADIRNADDVNTLCSDRDVVIHCASNTSPWGPYHEFAATNVQGTKNIVEGCLNNNVSRLVHVSSTSIQFCFRDEWNINENSPLPKRFACNYAKSKHVAETVVRSACDRGLNALIVRARAVYGPGDQSLLPRMLRVYDQGRLRQIGNGKNVTDLTYIDNLVYALILAIDHGESGQTFTVTGEEPVALWNLVRRILSATGRRAPLKKVPYRVALAFAQLSETTHRLFRKRQEPALTRYAVGLLAKSQTFDTESARRYLTYQPIVNQSDGIGRTITALTTTTDVDSSVQVRVQLFTTGYTHQPLHLAQQGADHKKVAFHATFALIDHPKHGLSLFDTGYSPRFFEATSRWPYRAYAKVTPVVTSPETQCSNVLLRSGVDPSQVRRIILSHMHADHICGLRDFPDADIILSATAWKSVAGVTGLAALRHAFLPGLLPDDITERLFLLPYFVDPGIGPFSQCHDLFSDGSVRLIDLPGHASGQIGALLQSGVNKRTFLVADAVWTRKTITENLAPTLAFRAFAQNANEVRATLSKLCDFHRHFPDIELVPTHCREVAIENGFDSVFAKALQEAD